MREHHAAARVNPDADAEAEELHEPLQGLRRLRRQRADDDLGGAELDHLLHVGDAAQAAPELDGNLHGADDAAHDLAVLRVSVGERAVEVNHVQHPRARVLESFRDLHGVAVVDLHLRPATLLQPHALPFPQVDGRND